MPVIDDLEIFIFVRLQRASNEEKPINSYDMGLEYYSNILKEYRGNKNRFLSSKNMFILGRAKKLNKEGLIDIMRVGKKSYLKFNKEKVLLKRHKFPSGLKNAIYIKDLKNKWTIYEI